MQILVCNNQILFFQGVILNEEEIEEQKQSEQQIWIPTLKLLHKFPSLLKKVQVDKGAIRHLLGGANMMCPGISSAGGDIDLSIRQGDIVAIYGEGKKQAIGIGKMAMDASKVLQVKKGVAVQLIHVIGDPFWNYNFTWNTLN